MTDICPHTFPQSYIRYYEAVEVTHTHKIRYANIARNKQLGIKRSTLKKGQTKKII